MNKFILSFAILFSPVFAHAADVHCGDVLTKPDTYLLKESIVCEKGIVIKGNDITLDCFTGNSITSDEMSFDAGVTVINSKNAKISNCVVEKWERGIVVQKSKDTLIIGTLVQYNTGDGITLTKSKNSYLNITSAENEGWGVVVEDSYGDTTLERSYVNGNGDGSLLVLNPRGFVATLNTTLNGDVLFDR